MILEILAARAAARLAANPAFADGDLRITPDCLNRRIFKQFG